MDPARTDEFRCAWTALGADGAAAGGALDDLSARYGEPGRSYHDLSHVTRCLELLDVVRHRAEHPHEVVLALWYHDAVYDPRRKDNEALSAELASQALASAGADPGSAGRVAALILATADHDPAAGGDAALVSDLDLAILGAPPDAYRAYVQAVRQEYGFVPDAAFRQGRRAFERAMALRPRLFHTPELHERLEAQARANLGG